MKKRTTLIPEPAGIYGLVLFLMMTIFSGSRMLGDADTFWHVKIGLKILEKGQIVKEDLFSHTALGTPWVAHEWLTEICMAVIVKYFGLAGLAITGILIVALTFNLLFRLNKELSNEWAALASLAICTPLVYLHLLARPHILSWLFGVIALSLLIRGRRQMWWLPVLTLIWANFHGSVILIIVFQSVFWVGSLLDNWPGLSKDKWAQWWDRTRNQFYILAISVLVIGLNPFGYQLLWFPLHVTKEIFVQNIHEWMPPNFQSLWYAKTWVIMLMLFVAYFWRVSSWSWRLLIIILLFQLFGHVRYISIAAIYISPWMAMALKTISEQRELNLFKKAQSKNEFIPSPWSGPILTILVCSLFLYGLRTEGTGFFKNTIDDLFPMPETYSEQAIEFLSSGYPEGNLLNEYRWGGYLIYALERPPKVFIDGRADMYGEEIFGDYITISRVEPNIDKLLEKYQINWVLFPRDHILIRYLMKDNNWITIFEDKIVKIIEKVPTENQAKITTETLRYEQLKSPEANID